MITPSEIYWVTRLDAIKMCCFLSSAMSFVVLGGSTIIALGALVENKDDQYRLFKKISFFTAPFFFVASLVVVFLPTTKEMAAIIVIPKIASSIIENNKMCDLPSKVVDLADKWIEELKPCSGKE